MNRRYLRSAWGASLLLAALLTPQAARTEHVYWLDRDAEETRPRQEDFGADVNLRVFEDFALLISPYPVEADRRDGFEPLDLPAGTVAVLARLRSGPEGDVSLPALPAPVVRRGRDFAVLAALPGELSYGHHLEPLRFTPRVESAAPRSLRKSAVDPALKAEIVDAVSEAEISRIVGELSGEFAFELNGNTITNDDRFTCRLAIRKAADYLEDRYQALGYSVYRQTLRVPCMTAWNIVAVKTGTTLPDEIVVVGGHYDATSQMDIASGPAPGAEDNASGTSVVLHLAEIFAGYPTERTVHFVAFGGEEQGLFGSQEYVVQALVEELDIVAVLNLDMVSAFDMRYQIDIEGKPDWPALNDLMDLYDANVAAFAPPLVTEQKFISFGSDHVPFQNAGFPAILVIESDYASYPYYHTTNDTWEKLDFPLGANVAEATAATLVDLAVPGQMVPVLVGSLAASVEGDTVRLDWTVFDDGGVTGFHVLRSIGEAPLRRLTRTPLPVRRGAMRFEDRVSDLARPVTVRYALEAVGREDTSRLPGEARVALAPRAALRLEQNHPNPFNPSTTIAFHLPEAGRVSLRVFNVAGREIVELLDRELGVGNHTVDWNGTDDLGRWIGSGVYYYRLRSDRGVATRRMILLE